jgi:hypothetical protein
MSVRSIDDYKNDKLPHFAVMALCVPCSHRWIGVVSVATSLFKLECPSCRACDSFGAVIPHEYSEALEAMPDSMCAPEEKPPNGHD